MLNKKLVLAALLGAALAADEVDPSTDPSGTTDPSTDPSGTTDPSTESTDPPKATEDDDDEKDDRLSRVWKETMPDNSVMVLCDQGESALWEDAKERLVKLAAAKASTALAYTDAESNFNTANGKRETARDELATFETEALPYSQAVTDADKIVNDLLPLTLTGTVTPLNSVDAGIALDAKIDLTEGVQTKVTNQLARVEGLLTAQRTQELEEATWEERRLASDALNAALVTAKGNADDDVTEMAQQLTTRSYLFQMAGDGVWPGQTNADWGTGCAFGHSKWNEETNAGTNVGTGTPANYDCYILEQTGATASTSVWEWSACYDGSLPIVNTGNVCKVKGLDDDDANSGTASDGLLAEATAKLGVSSPADGLYLAFQTANPHYNADVKLTKHNIAITNYLAWQKAELLSVYLTIAVWMGQNGASAWLVVANDYLEGTLEWTSAYSSGTNWQPWINAGMIDESSTPTYYAKVKADAVTKRQTFDGWQASDSTWQTSTALTPVEFLAAATALTDVWHGQWVLAALNAEKTWIGADATAGQQLVAANAVVTAEANRVANVNNTAAMLRWKTLAAAEVTAIQGDVTRARELLIALTAEVAEQTREEAAARTALFLAEDQETAKALAIERLGNASTPTGAYAVQAAAQTANLSIVEQRKYHEGRLAFYEAVLFPLAEKDKVDPTMMMKDDAGNVIMNSDAAMARDFADAAYEDGLALLNGLRDQCKKQAFMFAQERLQKATDAASAKASLITDVQAAYADTANFPAAPAIGALCNYPESATPDPAAKRPDCGEENCCGAAQRFLADGTKLSIETCQKPETTVYTYWPALPVNALVAPTSETWRFQCISAAGRLATSVAAVLATGYMLA